MFTQSLLHVTKIKMDQVRVIEGKNGNVITRTLIIDTDDNGRIEFTLHGKSITDLQVNL